MHKIAAADWRYVSLQGVVFKPMQVAQRQAGQDKDAADGRLARVFPLL
jgi:hypothetical protein